MNRPVFTADTSWRQWDFGLLVGGGQLHNMLAYGLYWVLWLGPLTLRWTWITEPYRRTYEDPDRR